MDIAGTRYVIADIGMRMLTPRELFTAQGFPRDYVIEGVWEQDSDGAWNWRSFTKNTQVSCVGNPVCPPVAAAVVKANCGQLVKKEDVAWPTCTPLTNWPRRRLTPRAAPPKRRRPRSGSSSKPVLMSWPKR